MSIKQNPKDYIDKKLLRRLKMLAIIISIMTVLLVYDIFTSHISILFVALGLVIGFVAGILVGRMFSIEWHEGSSKVISKLDLIGIIILIIYIIFSILRHWIFAHWFAGAILSAFTISFAEGVMFGRIFSLRYFIKKILTEQGKI